MATLPNIPVNTAITFGTVTVMGLVAYTATLRHKLDSQIHDNYRHAKLVDAGMQPETKQLKLAKDV